ncbi:MAG TPA: ATP synthase subunit I [Nitrospirota bacterium]|nr:ATP synthase subunit I [Nitrospirota bacterium]
MADNKQMLKETANAIIRQVAKKTALFVVLAVAGAIVLGLKQGAGQRWWFLPGGILVGAALALINFRWLAMSVERFSVRKDVSPVAAKVVGPVISFLKLSVIFIVLFVMIKWEVLHILGLVAGLSLCFAAIIWEGLAMLARGGGDH